MGRRGGGTLPQVRRHEGTGQGRVRFNVSARASPVRAASQPCVRWQRCRLRSLALGR